MGDFRFYNTPAPAGDPPAAPRIDAGDRIGRCYELAGRGVNEHREWTLVHGKAFDVQHAWLERDGWAYDAVRDLLMGCEQYKDYAKATAERRYSAQEALEQMLATNHWGPWHDDSEK